jgi:hypothetical protein
MEAQVFSVRAMPAQGHERRWCARRPFTRAAIEVRVVDDPTPNVMKDGKIVAFSYELTPKEMEELQADPHIAVSILGSPDADPLELNSLKAKIQELESEVAKARIAHQGEVEDLKAARTASAKLAEDMGAKVVQLEQQLAHISAQLAERGKKK